MSIAELEAHLRTHPDDWASWLVYGDWLSERGDVRGQLVPLEHRGATARLTPREAGALQREIDRLVGEHQRSWSPGADRDEIELEWRHGFVVGIGIEWADDLFEAVGELLQHPEARFLTSLRLRLPTHDDELDERWTEDGEFLLPSNTLGRFPSLDLSGILALDLAYDALADEAAAALAGCAQLRNLTALDLRYNHLGDQGIEALARSPHLAGLRSLHLQRNRFGAEGARALAGSEHLRQLEVLDLRYNSIGASGAAALAASPVVGRLGTLRLYRRDVGADGARALATSPRLPSDLRRTWSAT